MKREITEYLGLDTDSMEWLCNRCGRTLGSAGENYKEGCLIAARDPREIWRPMVDEAYNFSYNPGWARVVEFYCPGCGTMIEVELLPPGHPITHDIELDLDSLRHGPNETAEEARP